MNKYPTFVDVAIFRKMKKIERHRKIMTFFKKELPFLILFVCVLGAIVINVLYI